MNPLLIVLPFCSDDVALAKKLLQWTWDLEVLSARTSTPKIKMPLLIAADSLVPMEDCREIGLLARKAFSRVDSCTIRVDDKDWRAPNSMFGGVAQYIEQTTKFPFLWLEPDCTPLRAGWAERIAAEYHNCPKKFMGPVIECKDPDLPPLHLTGCSVYPQNAYSVLDKHFGKEAKFAWDVDSAKTVVGGGMASDTKVIQHFYGTKDLAPTFVQERTQGNEYTENTLNISFLNEEAVLFHRVKDGSLINVLRKMRTDESNFSIARQAPAGQTPPVVAGKKA